MRYDTALFDLDLTLFDFRASERQAFAACLDTIGLANQFDATFERYSTINHRLWTLVEQGQITPSEAGSRRFEILLDELGVEANPTDLSAQFQTGLGEFGELYEGAGKVLDELASRVELALVTNGIDTVQAAKVERLGLDRWFGTIIVSGAVGVAKPDPRIFDHVFDEIGDDRRSSSVMVGDSLASDMAGARAAGIAACWFAPNEATITPAQHAVVDHRISTLDEVLDLVS